MERRPNPLATIHLPVSLAVISHLQQPVLGVVPLATARTDQIAAPGRALAIVTFWDGEGGPATAGDQKHS